MNTFKRRIKNEINKKCIHGYMSHSYFNIQSYRQNFNAWLEKNVHLQFYSLLLLLVSKIMYGLRFGSKKIAYVCYLK